MLSVRGQYHGRGGMEAFELNVKPLDDKYLPHVFEIEVGPECTYRDWLDVVTGPEWLNLGIFKGDQFAGYVGLERTAEDIAELHVSVVRKALKPIQVRRMMIQAGIQMFHNGVNLLKTVHLQWNKPACRLANACFMPLDHLLIRHQLPHCVHTLHRDSYMSNPTRWEI